MNLSATMATQDGQVTFVNVALPDDWGPGSHTVTIYDDATNEELAVVAFDVDADGGVEPTPEAPISPTGGNLPETGGSGLGLLQWALIVLLIGGFLVLLARKRGTRLPTH